MVAIQIRFDLGPPARRAVFALLALVNEKPVLSATDVLRTHVEHLRRLLEPGREARAPGLCSFLIPGWTALCGP